MERRTLEAVIYEREPPIARIILNRADKDLPKSASGAARASWINDSQGLIELRKAR